MEGECFLHCSLVQGGCTTLTALHFWVAHACEPSGFQLGSLAAASWVCTIYPGQEKSRDVVQASGGTVWAHLKKATQS